MASKLPLSGVKILDLTAVVSGPMATSLLCDQGADVIKVEPCDGDLCRLIGPAKGDLSAIFISINRGKRSLALDLKEAAGRSILRELAQRADVLVENFRPGAMARLGLDYPTLSGVNPRLIYMSITGFGPTGPYAGGRVYDSVIQAVSGFAATHRDPGTDEPALLASLICDKLTAITAAQAIATALFARERDGNGQHVELSMLDAALAFLWPDAMYNHTFVDDPPAATVEVGASQKLWKTRDGYAATMSPKSDEFAALCRGFGREDLVDDPRFSTLAARRKNFAEFRALLAPAAAARGTDELVDALRAAGAPIGKVNERSAVMLDPQVVHNRAVADVDHGETGRVRQARPAARFHGCDEPELAMAPHIGADGVAVLKELGLDDARIDALIKAGIVRI
jgi:crotonobetainyl-CoA:carnitine CoA-transferase CaiB-like acyl-CoA transferase